VDRRTELRFGPDRRLTALTAAAGVGAAIGALATSDRAGRILLVIAAVLLASYAITDLAFWPRLVASPEGIVIRAPGGRARLAWADVERIEAMARTRLGLRSVTLEVDAGSSLHVLSRRALGTDPETAADLIAALDPRR
jgi:hypothetical protein